jgi:hypothetical protein
VDWRGSVKGLYEDPIEFEVAEQLWLRLRQGYRDLFLRTVMIFLMRLRILGGRILLVTL